ncbi:CMRF35-like molecule 5 isoform X2 [Paralichthys olivaceus]|uniref:CMRF35-like molecule 5 isoform X2 n=1 Tax=Paralichthys olivaceus TaxID=8255 RepID=UPI0037515F91
MLHFSSTSHCLLSFPIMKTTGGFVGFLDAAALCLIWLTKQTVVSGQLAAPEVVSAAYGGTVTVACQYHLQYREYTKYWCKGSVYNQCTIVVKTPRNRISYRSSIADDKQAGVFTVTMTSLRDTDEDVYWCVIARFGINLYTRVQLVLSPTVATPTSTTPTPTQTPAPTTAPTPAPAPTPTQAPAPTPIQTLKPTPKHDEISWWAILRWILFTLMFCCLISTHIAVWQIQTAKKNTSAAAISPSKMYCMKNYE